MKRHLDLFAGVGAISLAFEDAGYSRPIGFVEIDPHAQAVLRRHWPTIPIHGDITTRDFVEGEADVISGGFPCQDISCAGKRAGLSGSRSGLYRELVRAIRVVRPEIAFVENVADLLSDGMGTVLGDLAEIRGDIEWDCVPAAIVGAPHERDRVWIVAHATDTYSLDRRSRAGDEKGGQETGDGFDARPVADVADASDAARERCGQRRTQRPPDSFARIRDEARRNAADPYGARLAFREGLTRDAWEKLTPAEREAFGNERQSIWPDEPALSGVDDVTPHWVDRVRETGNTVVKLIPQLIAEALVLQDVQESPA